MNSIWRNFGLPKNAAEEETYYNDRFSIVVPIMQADQTCSAHASTAWRTAWSRQEGGQ
jgi:hypothetical protein